MPDLEMVLIGVGALTLVGLFIAWRVWTGKTVRSAEPAHLRLQVRELTRLPPELRTPRVEAAASELASRGFRELGGFSEDVGAGEVPVRHLYAQDHTTYASLFALSSGAPIVSYLTGFTDGAMLFTCSAEELEGQFGPLINQAEPDADRRLASHLATLRTMMAEKSRKPRAAGTLAERIELCRAWYRYYR